MHKINVMAKKIGLPIRKLLENTSLYENYESSQNYKNFYLSD